MPAWRAGAFARPRGGTHVDETSTPNGLDGYYGAPGTPSPLEPNWAPAPAMQPESPMQLSSESSVSFAPVAPPAPEVPAAAPVAVAPVAAAVAAASAPPAPTAPLLPPPPAPPAASVPEQGTPADMPVAVRVGAESTTEDSS